MFRRQFSCCVGKHSCPRQLFSSTSAFSSVLLTATPFSSIFVFPHAMPLTSRRTAMNKLSGNPKPLPAAEQKHFEKYNELDLPNAGRIDTIRKAGLAGPGQEWVATEKIHGTNYSAVLRWAAGPGTGHELRFAKRSGIMDPKEHFFCCQVLNPDFERWSRLCLDILKRKFNLPDIGWMQMYGELFGGKYEHPNLKKKSEQKCLVDGRTYWVKDVEIQEEDFPQYHYDLKWSCFDIAYSVDGDKDHKRLLTFEEYTDVCSQIPDLIYAKPLVRGTLDQCLSFDVENFITPMPGILGLGNYPFKKNYAEGIVVRHVRHGAPDLAEKQASTVIKVRSSIFMEMKHADMAMDMRRDFFDTVRVAAIKSAGGVATAQSEALMSKLESQANDLLLQHVSQGRLSNVLSKIGPHPILSGEVTKEMLALDLAKDALKDFCKELDMPEVLNVSYQTRTMLLKNLYLDAKKEVDARWPSLIEQYEGRNKEAV